ncbi:MAG: hypothetical protein PHH75_02345 [Candidatus Omnitrophica bacterium]|nr:hypothetical protein [Candidatus Omnitrophota bacterium]MDD5573998.1 hypothetical protein [Candidatus Omnitrophota bacterium]
MEDVSGIINGVVGKMDRYLWMTFGVLFTALVVAWLARTVIVVEHFLKVSRDVLGVSGRPKVRWTPAYEPCEIKGTYKGRDISVGVIYAGFKNEFLPLPHICMNLKESIGYNTGRLPHYAAIDKNTLIFLPKVSLVFGVFDKTFPWLFGKNYLIMALEKMLATAEDLERGHSFNEVFQ